MHWTNDYLDVVMRVIHFIAKTSIKIHLYVSREEISVH